jgi:hypothetical protein
MHSILGRLVLWVAEILDRSLLTVPELNDWHTGTNTNSSDLQTVHHYRREDHDRNRADDDRCRHADRER